LLRYPHYPGVRTIYPFNSRDDFISARGQFSRNRIIAEGVSNEEAQELLAKTPLNAYIGYAVYEALYNPQVIDWGIFDMNMHTALGAIKYQLREGLREPISFDNEADYYRYIKRAINKALKLRGIKPQDLQLYGFLESMVILDLLGYVSIRYLRFVKTVR
jgi:hypothetical protein